MTSVQKISTVN